MQFIDIHAHLDFPDFDSDREEILSDMRAQGIGSINIGTTLDTSRNSIALAQTHDNVWAIVGIHPLHAHDSQLADFDEIKPLISHERCVGIGECGLDFFREANDGETKARQLSFFEKQIELALIHNKLLMIHCRQAYPETLDVLMSYRKSHPSLKAHFHFFTESVETARLVLDAGFTVSFTGVITFADYGELVSFVPLDNMMIETDSPYAAPRSRRGQRNDPRNVIEIAQKIANIKKLPEHEVFAQIRDTTKRVFGI